MWFKIKAPFPGKRADLLFYTGLCLTTLAGSLIRFWDLNRQSLWQDEIHTALYVRDFPALWEVIRRVAVWDLHAPLYYVLLWAEVWAERFCRIPLTDGNLRWLSALLGTVALPFLYLFFRKLFLGRGWALGALCLGAFNMYALYYSQELRMYAAILALAPLVLYSQLSLWSAVGALNKKMAAVYAAGNILLLYSSLICTFFVAGTWAALFLLVWFERRQHPQKWRQVFFLGSMIFLGYLPWVGVMWRQSLTIKAGVVTGMVIDQPRELLKFALENLWFHAWKLGWGFDNLSRLARLLMPLALLNLLDKESRPRHGLMLLGFALTFFIYFVVTLHKPFHTGRYFSPWWPWAIYFLVAGFSGLETVLRKLRFRWPLLAAILAVIFGGIYLGVQVQNARYYFSGFEKENYREAVKKINARQEGSFKLLVAGSWQRKCFEYYGSKVVFITPEEFSQSAKPDGAAQISYIGVRPPQDEPELAGLGLQTKQQPWEIKSLNYYLLRSAVPAPVFTRADSGENP